MAPWNLLNFKKMNKIIYLLTVILGVGALPLQAESSPQADLEATVAEVVEILYDPSVQLDARQKQLEAALDSRFSFEVISQRAVGHFWKRFKPEEKERFAGLFKELLIQSYTSGLEADDLGSKPEISWEGQRELKKGLIEISSSIRMDNSRFPIVYRMAKLENGWQVYDILVEGVSLIGNYRKQFAGILQRGNMEDLFSALKQKVEANKS